MAAAAFGLEIAEPAHRVTLRIIDAELAYDVERRLVLGEFGYRADPHLNAR